jgi:hypothetical protein
LFRHFRVVVVHIVIIIIIADERRLVGDGWRLGASNSRVVGGKWRRLDCAGCLSPTAGLAAGEAVGEEGEEGNDAVDDGLDDGDDAVHDGHEAAGDRVDHGVELR